MRRLLYLACPATLLQIGGCLPDDFFQNLFGSAIAEVASAVLSDFLNVVLPPI